MSNSKKAFMVGTGGHAQMMQQLIAKDPNLNSQLCAWLEASDYEGEKELLGLPVLKQNADGFERLKQLGTNSFYFGLGMVKAAPWRATVYAEILSNGFNALTYVHPTAIIDSSATIGDGTFIGAGVIIQPFVTIEEACLINTGSIVEHHVTVGYNTHIGPGTIICGQATVDDHCMIGAGSVILQQVQLGKNVTIGAGSTVIDNIPDHKTAFGKPATLRSV